MRKTSFVSHRGEIQELWDISKFVINRNELPHHNPRLTKQNIDIGTAGATGTLAPQCCSYGGENVLVPAICS